MLWPSILREGVNESRRKCVDVFADFGDEICVVLVAGWEFCVWRVGSGEGEASERSAAGPL